MDDAIHEQALALVVAKIREVVNEDWIADFEIDAETRFSQDLEIDSLEFVRILEAIHQDETLQRGPDASVDVTGWLSGRTMQELSALRVGDVADVLARARRPGRQEENPWHAS